MHVEMHAKQVNCVVQVHVLPMMQKIVEPAEIAVGPTQSVKMGPALVPQKMRSHAVLMVVSTHKQATNIVEHVEMPARREKAVRKVLAALQVSKFVRATVNVSTFKPTTTTAVHVERFARMEKHAKTEVARNVVPKTNVRITSYAKAESVYVRKGVAGL